MPIPAIVPPLLSAGASIFSALSAKRGQDQANRDQMEFNASEAQKQRDFEERMSGTAFQRARRDLENAGYNPLLAFGHPASTPSGSAASISPRSSTEKSSEIFSTTARQMADLNLTRELAETERSKQQLNRAQASGSIGLPFGTAHVPISTAKQALSRTQAAAAGFFGLGSKRRGRR